MQALDSSADASGRRYQLIVALVATLIFIGCMISPPSLMDDVDAVQAQIARNMLQSGDWVTARLDGIWGERDATAYPHLDERARILRGFQANARFAVVPGAGHWVQYEAADPFNALIAEFAAG